MILLLFLCVGGMAYANLRWMRTVEGRFKLQTDMILKLSGHTEDILKARIETLKKEMANGEIQIGKLKARKAKVEAEIHEKKTHGAKPV